MVRNLESSQIANEIKKKMYDNCKIYKCILTTLLTITQGFFISRRNTGKGYGHVLIFFTNLVFT